MEYVRLGKTDLLISRVAFGAMKLTEAGGDENVALLVRKAYESGINCLIHREKLLRVKNFLATLFMISGVTYFFLPLRQLKLQKKLNETLKQVL